jgi:hypothetical protein
MMKRCKHPILVRSAHDEFVRVIGLREHERERLAGRIRRLRSMECGTSTVIQYGLYGWLEVREVGLFCHPYEERVKLTDALKEGILKLVHSEFPRR